MKRKLYFFLVLFSLGMSYCSAQTMHAILVINTESIMTEFAKIGQADSINMTKELEKMSNEAGLTLKTYLATGTDFIPSKVEALVQSVEAKEEDVIFFYYSGASYCEKEDPKKEDYRMMRLGIDSKSICSSSSLFSTLEAKNARLNIFMMDGCSANRQTKPLSGKKAAAEHKVYASLLSVCGTIKLFSSKCTELSYGDAQGSYFTNSFLLGLDHFINLGAQELSWETLVNWTSSATHKMAMANFRPQHPVGVLEEVKKCK